MKRSTERDYYYNTPDVYMPKTYRKELPDHKDYIDSDNQYVLIHPRWLSKEHRTRFYQLAKIQQLIVDDGRFVDQIIVRLACNGNTLSLDTFHIMAFAHPEDIELWKELYGELHCDLPPKNNRKYGRDFIDDACDDIDQEKEFWSALEAKARKKYNIPDDVEINWTVGRN